MGYGFRKAQCDLALFLRGLIDQYKQQPYEKHVNPFRMRSGIIAYEL